MRAGLTSPPTCVGAAGAVGCFELSEKFPPRVFSPPESASPLTSSAGSITPLGCTLAARPTLGLARRTFPREDLLISGSRSSVDFSGALIISLSEFALGMRSVIAAACTLPWVGEETGANVSGSAFAELAFVAEEDVAAAVGVNAGVASEPVSVGAPGCDAGGVEDARDVFEADVLCAGAKNPNEPRKYHAPLPAAITRPAAIAIHTPLLLPCGLITSGVLSSRREFPNRGAAGVCFGGLVGCFVGAGVCFCGETDSGTGGFCHCSNSLPELLPPSSAVGSC